MDSKSALEYFEYLSPDWWHCFWEAVGALEHRTCRVEVVTREHVWEGHCGDSDCSVSLLPGPPWCEEPPLHVPAATTTWNALKLGAWVNLPSFCCVCRSLSPKSSFNLPGVLAILHNLTSWGMAPPPLLSHWMGVSPLPIQKQGKQPVLDHISILSRVPVTQDPQTRSLSMQMTPFPALEVLPRLFRRPFSHSVALLELSLYRHSSKMTTWSCRPSGCSHVL